MDYRSTRYGARFNLMARGPLGAPLAFLYAREWGVVNPKERDTPAWS
jgi:hypothetical protein